MNDTCIYIYIIIITIIRYIYIYVESDLISKVVAGDKKQSINNLNMHCCRPMFHPKS